MSDRPVPTPTAETAPFWAAATEGRLAVPRCRACGQTHFYPRVICIHCGSTDLSWIECSGRGTVYTFTVNHRAAHPSFKEHLPYIVAVIELEEGCRLFGNLRDVAPDHVRIGMDVEVYFEQLTPDVALPQFRPTGSGRPGSAEE